MVSYVNLEWKPLYVLSNYFLRKHVPMVCNNFFELLSKVNGETLDFYITLHIICDSPHI